MGRSVLQIISFAVERELNPKNASYEFCITGSTAATQIPLRHRDHAVTFITHQLVDQIMADYLAIAQA